METKTKKVEHPIKKLRKRTPSKLQERAIANLVETRGNVSLAMRKAGYSPKTAKNPKVLTTSKAFEALAGEFLPDTDILGKHRELLFSTRLDHMVFPLGPSDDEGDSSEEQDKFDKEIPESLKDRTTLSDLDIIALLADVNCTVRKIVHGETARHVYFWSPDNKAREAGVELAYKLFGRLKDKGNTENKILIINISQPAAQKYGINPSAESNNS